MVFNVIKPLDNLRKLRRGFALHLLDLTRNFGDRSGSFALHSIETRLQICKRSGVYLRLALCRAQCVDTGFEGPDVIGRLRVKRSGVYLRLALRRAQCGRQWL